MRQLIFLFFFLPIIALGQQSPTQILNTPWQKINYKLEVGQRLLLPPDTLSYPPGATVRDTTRLLAFAANGNLYKLWNGVWSLIGAGGGTDVQLLSDTAIVVGDDTLRIKPITFESDMPPAYFFKDGDTIRDYTLQYLNDSVKIRKSGDTLFFPNGDTLVVSSTVSTGYAIDGDGSGGDPIRLDSATLRGDYIRNQYAAREAKSLWVDSVRGNVVRFDTLSTNSIPNQYIPIFVDGRMRGFRTIQHNAVGFRVLQRNASEGFSASDLGIRFADSTNTTQLFAVRWDGRTTIGTGTTTNFIDVYGTQGGFNNTNIRVKTNSTTGDARLMAENSGTGRIYLQAVSSSASPLANQGSLLVENLPKFEFMTDGQLATGGTSPFYWKAGGYSVTPQFSVFASNQVGVGVGTTAPSASAIFEVKSTTAGFLPPRMTATQASAISSPAEGLLVYVTDTNGTFTSKGWWGYNGAAWEKLNN